MRKFIFSHLSIVFAAGVIAASAPGILQMEGDETFSGISKDMLCAVSAVVIPGANKIMLATAMDDLQAASPLSSQNEADQDNERESSSSGRDGSDSDRNKDQIDEDDTEKGSKG